MPPCSSSLPAHTSQNYHKNRENLFKDWRNSLWDEMVMFFIETVPNIDQVDLAVKCSETLPDTPQMQGIWLGYVLDWPFILFVITMLFSILKCVSIFIIIASSHFTELHIQENKTIWNIGKNNIQLTLKVLNFWKFTSYCSLKTLMVGHWRSSAGSYLADPTSPSPPTVHQLSRLAL